MAIAACGQLKLPLEVSKILESFLIQEHHQLFIKRYGRNMPCTISRFYATESMPQIPGFVVSAWFLHPTNYKRLTVGMEFVQMGQLYDGTRVIESVTESAITVSRIPAKADLLLEMPFAYLRDVILFVSSPGAYMLFVGRDRYTGDLSDLKPLREGEQMSELEVNIRHAHWEQSVEAEFMEDFNSYDWN
jgi:hypothetical protein